MRTSMLAAFSTTTIGWLLLFSAPATGQRGGASVSLPDGAGKQLVEATCAKCHGLNLVTSSWGYTKQGWHELIGTMVALPKDQADTITTNLASAFPEKPAPPGGCGVRTRQGHDQGVAGPDTGRDRAIRCPRVTDRSGGRRCTAIGSAASISKPAT